MRTSNDDFIFDRRGRRLKLLVELSDIIAELEDLERDNSKLSYFVVKVWTNRSHGRDNGPRMDDTISSGNKLVNFLQRKYNRGLWQKK